MASASIPPDTLVTLKVIIDGTNRRFKLPLRNLVATTLPDKLRYLLDIPPTSDAVFERYSDSAAAFVVLDPKNTSVYKQLYRAAKAKLKLRLRVTTNNREAALSKPVTVDDKEISPAENQSTHQNSIEPVSSSFEGQTPAVTSPENTAWPGSVAEIQRNFEQLLISNGARSSQIPRTNATPSYDCQVTKDASTRACLRNPVPEMNGASKFTIPPIGNTPREDWLAELGSGNVFFENFCDKMSSLHSPVSIFTVYCNKCNASVSDEHYHCSNCDDGDYDLCRSCVSNGILCPGEDHWLIKRSIKNGRVINSTTETIAQKSKNQPKVISSPIKEKQDISSTRTCNSCIEELTEEKFVTCTYCSDFDLCIPCHVRMEHGHHPKHAFTPAVEGTRLGNDNAQALLAPGRNVAHHATCDGCDKYVYGVRHKCLDCPDWDYCSACIGNAKISHPGHRFVPLYEPLDDSFDVLAASLHQARHHGIYCDGPLCNGKGIRTYIRGDRYKCAVCNDTDFCARCEASPSNIHNRTHPLIKFKTPVRNVSVTTLGDHEDGSRMPVMGDRIHQTTSKGTETTPAQSANAATQVQTVADLKPTGIVEDGDSAGENNFEAKAEVKKLPVFAIRNEIVADKDELVAAKENFVAHFVRDVITDGTVLAPSIVFKQTWYLLNAGETAWPAGCSVKFVGGDNMCAVDPEHPASVRELVSAAESTICYTEVSPGQEVGFTVLMRTPARPGHFISYWRLTGPDGNKFGHRLWCDVNVEEATAVFTNEPIAPMTKSANSQSIATEEAMKPKTDVEGSQMIFPKLEKEFPVASIDDVVVADVSEVDDLCYDDDFVDDTMVEDMAEDGFMTDEEYDILDASDQEYIAEQSKTLDM